MSRIQRTIRLLLIAASGALLLSGCSDNSGTTSNWHNDRSILLASRIDDFAVSSRGLAAVSYHSGRDQSDGVVLASSPAVRIDKEEGHTLLWNNLGTELIYLRHKEDSAGNPVLSNQIAEYDCRDSRRSLLLDQVGHSYGALTLSDNGNVTAGFDGSDADPYETTIISADATGQVISSVQGLPNLMVIGLIGLENGTLAANAMLFPATPSGSGPTQWIYSIEGQSAAPILGGFSDCYLSGQGVAYVNYCGIDGHFRRLDEVTLVRNPPAARTVCSLNDLPSYQDSYGLKVWDSKGQTLLAEVGYKTDPRKRIYMLDADSHSFKFVVFGENARFSADGKHIYYLNAARFLKQEGTELRECDLDGKNDTVIFDADQPGV